MSEIEKPKYLNHKLETKRKLLFRYFHAYNRAHHEILWQLEEIGLLVRMLEHAPYNMWMLNESLYKYAEASISALNWMSGESKDHPFIHQFLREWRNEYHHDAKVDFRLSDVGFHVDGKSYKYSDEYFVVPVVIRSERLKKLVKKFLGTDHIATNANVKGLVEHHHLYMLSYFQEHEKEMQSKMPDKFLVHNQQSKSSLGGGKHEKLLLEKEFWSQ